MSTREAGPFGADVGMALGAQEGMERANRKLYDIRHQEGLLELQMRLLEMRQQHLNQMNTQAALVASCSVALLSSGELDIMNKETLCPADSIWHWPPLFIFCEPTEWALNFAYMTSALCSVMWALWTIYISNHLISSSMFIAREGNRDDILHFERALSDRVRRVEKGFEISLLCLIFAMICMIAEEVFWFAAAVAAPITFSFVIFADSEKRKIDDKVFTKLRQDARVSAHIQLWRELGRTCWTWATQSELGRTLWPWCSRCCSEARSLASRVTQGRTCCPLM